MFFFYSIVYLMNWAHLHLVNNTKPKLNCNHQLPYGHYQ